MPFIEKYKDKRENGFTLIEILVVIGVIGILAAIAVPLFLNQRKQANDAAIESDVKNLAITLQDLPKDAQNFSRIANVNVGYLSEGATKSMNIKMSNNTWWTVSGNHLKYCIVAYSLNGNKYTNANPLYYDSTAGGIGKKGEACDPQDDQDTTGAYVSRGNHLTDATFATYNIVTPTNQLRDLSGYFGLTFKTIATTTPVGNKAIEGITNGSNVQGLIMTQSSTSSTSRPIQKAGEKWTASIYVKAPAGELFDMGVRVTDVGGGYGRETGNTFSATGAWQRVTYEFTSITSDIGHYPGIQAKQKLKTPDILYQFAGPQVELGTTATTFK